MPILQQQEVVASSIICWTVTFTRFAWRQAGRPASPSSSSSFPGYPVRVRQRAQEAAAQFRKALARMPNRSLSLLGAARAAVRLGDEAAARELYARLAESWRQADSESSIWPRLAFLP